MLAAALLAVGAWRGAVWWADHDFRTSPPETPGTEKLFYITQGETPATVARNLLAENLVKDSRRFLALLKERGKDGSVRAGEFALSTGMLPDQVVDAIVTPGIIRRVLVREGLSWRETMQAVDASQAAEAEDFRRAVFDPELLGLYGVPAASPEGFLFPDTYLVSRPKEGRGRHVAELMLRTFRKNASQVWPQGLPEPKELFRLVTLASLVEKETGLDSERARIAGVFVNRLAKGMRLQSDPTIIYGLGEGFDGDIKRKDLDDEKNPYNTYQHAGLPPGPICSPGLASLKAAADPERHEYLYFVATGNGGHHFSRTLDEHNAAVARLLKKNRAAAKAGRGPDQAPQPSGKKP